jgi:hypothetical protein
LPTVSADVLHASPDTPSLTTYSSALNGIEEVTISPINFPRLLFDICKQSITVDDPDATDATDALKVFGSTGGGTSGCKIAIFSLFSVRNRRYIHYS